DAETGITYQLITAGLDQGPILKQIPYPLNGTETSESLYRALFDLAAQQLPAVLNDYLADKLPPKPQDESRVSYTYSSNRPESTQISKEDAKINWSASTNKIYAAIRAYNPWPIAWTTLEELTEAKEKVAELTALKDPQNASKTVKIYSASLLSDRTLLVDKLQVAGGKVLTWQEFKNGYLA
ncbi:hypothetical protein KJ605_02385, partial [Patescibacteria group bacterium]|nr:hypothetical protein [Patescibacteria group bacterium]